MKNFRHLIAALLTAACFSPMFADAPAGYYSSLNGLKDAQLKTAVHNLVRSFTQVSSYSALPTYFQRTDVYPNSRRWWDMYSDIPLYSPSFAGLNREHSFPKSWWGGITTIPAYVDLNHLYPSEQAANMAKSNYPLGIVATADFDNDFVKVGYPVNGQGGGAKFVFEPNDDYKGDFARTYFYMVTCYQNLTWRYTYMMNQNTYPTLTPWAAKLLLEWHRNDPVSQKEIDRNEVVFSIQNNRNPFIDLPELAEYIWGEKVGESFSPGAVVITGDPELIAPSKGMTLDFNQVALGNSVQSKLLVKGKNLTGSIKAQIYSGDNAMFTTTITNIPATGACTDDGYWIAITYKPTAIGSHSSKILLEGAFGSRAVTLLGECKAVPTLSACTATAASDITPDSYTANWTCPDEDVDYFVLTRTRYIGNNVTTEELVSETNSLEITDFADSDRESYTVQSESVGVRSPMSNVIFVEHAGITGVSTGEPLAVVSAEGTLRFICSAPQTGCRIYNMAGREVLYLDTIDQNTTVELPSGVYIIITDRHPTPIKATIY